METDWINGKNVWCVLVGLLVAAAIGRFLELMAPKQKNLPIVEKNLSLVKRNLPIIEIKVRKGWCLSKIAEDLGTSVKDLAELNGIKNINLIYPGQTIKVVPFNRNDKVKVSWYGSDFHGKTMSNKKTFDMRNPNIAAHKLLPFDTKVKLTRIDNGKSIVVAVHDRGPYVKGRSFDISYAAAELLGITTIGVAECEAKILN